MLYSAMLHSAILYSAILYSAILHSDGYSNDTCVWRRSVRLLLTITNYCLLLSTIADFYRWRRMRCSLLSLLWLLWLLSLSVVGLGLLRSSVLSCGVSGADRRSGLSCGGEDVSTLHTTSETNKRRQTERGTGGAAPWLLTGTNTLTNEPRWTIIYARWSIVIS
jgi:hypothetical protein